MAAHPWGDGYEAEHEDMNPLSSASHLSFREQDNLHSYSSPPPGPALQDSQFRTQIRDEDLETQVKMSFFFCCVLVVGKVVSFSSFSHPVGFLVPLHKLKGSLRE